MYFYPRPPGGGRQLYGTSCVPGKVNISIHALRVEGDICTGLCISDKLHFYPRPPGGGRQARLKRRALRSKFLSTPSGWRATVFALFQRRAGFISIHALRVEGDLHLRVFARGKSISIHALRVEGDSTRVSPCLQSSNFYPRPPGGGRRCTPAIRAFPTYFYPRPPGGGRQQKRTKFSSVFAQKGEEFASLRRGKRKFAGGVLKRTNFGF